MTTKILALTDALGNLVRFILLPGHRFDTVGVAPLIDGLAFEGFIADKAFDSNSIIADLNERGAKIVISPHPRRALALPIDAEIYKWRHLIENFFCKLKEFKRIAMRADKTDQSFAANILAQPKPSGLFGLRTRTQVGDCVEQHAAVPYNGDVQILQVLRCQAGQDLFADRVLAENGLVLFETNAPQPHCQVKTHDSALVG